MRLNLVRSLAARGFEVDLVLCVGLLPVSERDQLPASVRVIELKKKRIIAAWLPLVRYFRRGRPLGVLCAEDHLNIIATSALRFSRIRAVISISFHVSPSLEASKTLWTKARWVSIIGHWVFPRTNAIVAISSGMADTLARVARLPRDSITVIYNPVVSDSLFQKSLMAVEPAPSCRESSLILSVGRLHPSKGFLDVLEAFASLRKKRDLQLVILGEGPQRAELEARIRDLGLENNVYLAGAVDNPYAWMARSQLFVLASQFEGLSNVIIEALACGCPVVSTDCPTGPREILEDGQFGELVPMHDPKALARAMERTLDEPLAAETLKARAMDFHVERIVDQYLQALGLPSTPEAGSKTRTVPAIVADSASRNGIY